MIFFQQLRIHQWSKNFLIFLPAALTSSTENVILLLKVFISFSLLASALYCINDLIDVKKDKLHPIKKKRPLASDKLNLYQVLGLSAICIFLFYLFAYSFDSIIIFFFFYYILISLLYNIFLKRIFIINVITLSCLYVLRVMLGSKVIGIEATSNLIIFIFFFFLALASIKKYIDISVQKKKNISEFKTFKNLIILANAITVSTLVVYLNSDLAEVVIGKLNLYALIIAVTYWLTLASHKTISGKIKTDPVIYFLKDKISIITGIVIIFLLTFKLDNIILY